MEEESYQKTQFGQATQQPGDKWAFTYYLPQPIPRDLPFDLETVRLLSDADNAIGHLQGLSQLIPQPDLLVGPFLTREALASSRIEGTNASLTEVLRAEEVEEPRNDDIAEVGRYLMATRRGLELIRTLPITQRLIKEVHKTLLEDVRGKERQPGEMRSSPVWIGGSNPTNALFVPPLPEHMPDLITDWERFINTPSRLPLLVRAALMHYQFETIHPFLDGNGRIGRLLIGLFLIIERRLTAPLLYLSGYMETHRRAYYDRLQAVRETGDIQGWLRFFFAAVKAQSDDAVERARRIVALREEYYQQSSTDRSRVTALIPLIFHNPFITVTRIQRSIEITTQGARNLLDRAMQYGWLEYMGAVGSSGRHYYSATRILEIVETPTSYAQEQRDVSD